MGHPEVPEGEPAAAPPPRPVAGLAPALSLADLAIVRAAATAGWQIPDVVKRAAVVDCALRLADPDATNRERTAANRCLVAIERLNLISAELPQEADVRPRLIIPEADVR